MTDRSTTYLICWTNVTHPYEREYEEFESLEDAQSKLIKWVVEYPWNTYTLTSVIGVSPATVSRDEITSRVFGKVKWVDAVYSELPKVARLLKPIRNS